MLFDLEHNNWPACFSCWENSDETWVCPKCERFADDSFRKEFRLKEEAVLTRVERTLSLEWEKEWSLSILIWPEGWSPERIQIDYSLIITNNREIVDDVVLISNISFTVTWDKVLLSEYYTDSEIEDIIRKAFYWEK